MGFERNLIVHEKLSFKGSTSNFIQFTVWSLNVQGGTLNLEFREFSK